MNRIIKEWNISIESKMESIGETWEIGVGGDNGRKARRKERKKWTMRGGWRRHVSPDE